MVETVEKPTFDFSVSWSSAPAKAARRRCKARVDYAGGGGKGGMAVMELGLFTGTAVAADSLAALHADHFAQPSRGRRRGCTAARG